MSNGSESSGPPAIPEPSKTERKGLDEAPKVLEPVPEKKGPQRQMSVIHEEVSIRAGPLPAPKELAAYDAIIPDGANRIMKMAEDQSAHRIRIEGLVIKSQQRQSQCGQWFGLIIGLCGLGLSTYAAIRGQPTFGAIIGGTTLVGLVTAFLTSQDKQKADLQTKREQMNGAEREPSQGDQQQQIENRKPPPPNV